MPTQAVKIAELRNQGKRSKFDYDSLKANCKDALIRNKWLLVDPLAVWYLIDKVRRQEKEIEHLRAELQQATILYLENEITVGGNDENQIGRGALAPKRIARKSRDASKDPGQGSL
jgi:hypothetical protein